VTTTHTLTSSPNLINSSTSSAWHFCPRIASPVHQKTQNATLDSAQADKSKEVMMVDVDWRVEIIDYITGEKLPTEKK